MKNNLISLLFVSMISQLDGWTYTGFTKFAILAILFLLICGLLKIIDIDLKKGGC